MALCIDVTDTLASGLWTGVQRVVVETARSLQMASGARLVRFHFSKGVFLPLTSEEIGRLYSGGTTPGTGRPCNFLVRWGIYRPLARVLDLFRQVFLTRPHRFAEDWDQTLYFTAEVVGDRARTRKLKDWSSRPGFRMAFVVHDLIPWTNPDWSLLNPRDFLRYLGLLKKARQLFPVSRSTQEQLLRWAGNMTPFPAVQWLYPGFTVPPGRPVVLSIDPPLFLCVGTIEPRKNQERLLEVLDSLWARGRRFTFVFVGSASALSPGFADKVRGLQAHGRTLDWYCPAAESQLEALYRSATATVYLSQVEGFGLPIIESVARGVPCIASNQGAVGEVAGWYGGCLTVDPRDPGAWLRVLEELLDQPDLRARLASTIRTDRFMTWEAYGQALTDLLEAP